MKMFRNNEDSSPTTSLRHHLREHHETVWKQECVRLGIPIKLENRPNPTSDTPKIEPFTKDGLLKHLIEFISSDDQVCSIQFMLEEPLLTDAAVDKCR